MLNVLRRVSLISLSNNANLIGFRLGTICAARQGAWVRVLGPRLVQCKTDAHYGDRAVRPCGRSMVRVVKLRL